MPAEISIGGLLTPKQIQGLSAALLEDGVQNEEFCSIVGITGILNIIIAASRDGIMANFADDQAPGGQFVATELFCNTNKIPFRRHSDSYAELDAEICTFRPDLGQKDWETCESDSQAAVMIPLDILRSELEKGRDVHDIMADYNVFEAPLPALKIDGSEPPLAKKVKHRHVYEVPQSNTETGYRVCKCGAILEI